MAKVPEREAKPLSLAGPRGCVSLALGPLPAYSRSRACPSWPSLAGGWTSRAFRGAWLMSLRPERWLLASPHRSSTVRGRDPRLDGSRIGGQPRTEEQSRNRHLPRLPGGPVCCKSHCRTGLSPHNSLRTSPWMGGGTYVLCTKLLLYAFSPLYVAQRGSHPWIMMESSSSHGCVVGYVDLRPPIKTNLQVCRVWALISSVDGGLIKQRSSPRRGLLGVALVPLVLAFIFNLGLRLIWNTSTF